MAVFALGCAAGHGSVHASRTPEEGEQSIAALVEATVLLLDGGVFNEQVGLGARLADLDAGTAESSCRSWQGPTKTPWLLCATTDDSIPDPGENKRVDTIYLTMSGVGDGLARSCQAYREAVAMLSKRLGSPVHRTTFLCESGSTQMGASSCSRWASTPTTVVASIARGGEHDAQIRQSIMVSTSAKRVYHACKTPREYEERHK